MNDPRSHPLMGFLGGDIPYASFTPFNQETLKSHILRCFLCNFQNETLGIYLLNMYLCNQCLDVALKLKFDTREYPVAGWI